MNNDNDIDYSTLLTPEIMATMPANLSAVDQFTWRQSKQNTLACEYKEKQKQNCGHFSLEKHDRWIRQSGE